jgi:CheY-like chemotaxis protein
MLWDLKDVCDPEFAGDGARALALHRQRRFDVIVADLQMPMMNGWELLKAAHSAYPAVRCFVLTGDPSPADFAKAIELDYGLIEKPCSPETLKSAIFGGQDKPCASSPRKEGDRP